MVMHARKIPRLNDGYYDRGSTHPFQDKGSSKSRDSQYNDKFSRKDSSNVDKHSPRYSSKSSYKDRIDRGKSRTPDDDRRANHHSSTSHKDSGSRHGNHSVRSSSSTSTKINEKKPMDKNEHRIEIQKSALRICNDWSEHLSSSGKRYYYNCKTEVSKWEKPKDWIDEKAVRTEYGRRKEVQLQKQGSQDRSKHSSSSATNSHSSSRYNQSERSGGGASSSDKQYKSRSESSRDYRSSDKNYSNSSSGGGGASSTQRRGGAKDSQSSSSTHHVSQSALSALQNPRVLNQRYDSSGGGSASKDHRNQTCSSSSKSYRDKYGRTDSRPDRRGDSRGGGGNSTPRSRQGSLTPGGTADRDSLVNSYRYTGDRRPTIASQQEDTVDRQPQDMDISPGSTPTEESLARGLTTMLPTSSTPSHLPNTSHPLHLTPNSAHPHAHHLTSAAVSAHASSHAPTHASYGTTVSVPQSVNSPILGAVAALPGLISQIGDKTLRGITQNSQQSGGQGSAKLNTAIQTLQKLQEALMAQQRQQQQQLASLIQQQLQQQQLSSASPSNQLPARSNGTSLGHSVPHSVPHPGVGVSNTSGHGLMSPGMVHAGAAMTNHGHSQSVTHVVSSAHYLHTGSVSGHTATHSPGLSLSTHLNTATNVSTPHSTHAHTGPLYVQVANENGGGGAQSPGAESAGTPLCSPELNLPDDSLHKTDTEKDTSQEDIRLGSPGGESTSSSQKAAALTGLAAAATLAPQDSYKLPPSLANFYNDQLISHVAYWPTDGIERQADHIKNESHTVGNIYSTQVSCELKKARSLVRVSEIQSTLQEQRVLFIRQQIKDLESFRNTNISFMSPKSGR